MNIKKKIATSLAASVLLLNTFMPFAFADTTIQISGNGSSSNNTATVTSNNSSTVVQSNNATINNTVDSHASTGGNTANDNTGGNTTVNTGNATSNVDVTTRANLNHADVANCNCATDTTVSISGNGSSSTNNATLTTNNTASVFQDNNARINNRVDSIAKTGGNDANDNTGGSTTVLTGNATSNVTVNNAANANMATVGAGAGSGGGTTVSVSGNGSLSSNAIALSENNSAMVVQDNHARINNRVDSMAKTGRNTADDNTGGNVTIDTGDANASTTIDNMANFNAADIGDCACVSGVLAKIFGNGSRSRNDIFATLGNNSSVFQGGEGAGNNAHFNNNLFTKSKAGFNDASDNTGAVSGLFDPVAVLTGSSISDTAVHNSANVNIVGSDRGFPLMFHFDMGEIMHFLHMMHFV